MNQFNEASTTKNRGQSLVEVALFLPIFLIIIAGLVEVSQIVLTQNRVSNAARVAARFGANGGEDDGILEVTMNAVTQTLELDENLWDVWVVRVEFDQYGVIKDSEWEFNHIYGLTQTVAYDTIIESDVKAQVQEELTTDQNGNRNNNNAANLKAVGVLLVHDIDSILGLDALPFLQGLHSTRALNMMRITGLQIEQTNGCSAFPIAVEDGIRNVTSDTLPTDFDYLNPDLLTPLEANFPNNPWTEAKYSFQTAVEGTVFLIKQSAGSGNFGWLAWNTGLDSSGDLAESLTWPGTSTDYDTNNGNVGNNDKNIYTQAGFDHQVLGFIEAGDPTDTSLNIGDWVAASTGNTNDTKVKAQLQAHVNTGRTLRVIIWSADDPEQIKANSSGSNTVYRVKGFAIVRLHGYDLPGNGSTLLAEFIRWDTSCGQSLP